MERPLAENVPRLRALLRSFATHLLHRRSGTCPASILLMAKMKLTLECSAFENGAEIPTEFTADGLDRPPDLRWAHAPDGTRSLVLIMDDPDAPSGTFTHWVRYDLPEGKDGRNDFQTVGYRGPAPPPRHGGHRYFFHLYALDVDSLGLPPGAPRMQVEEAMRGHVLDETTLMGRYETR
jgi:Raf kinase inhibitor-like YbhB/YbcL family protein